MTILAYFVVVLYTPWVSLNQILKLSFFEKKSA